MSTPARFNAEILVSFENANAQFDAMMATLASGSFVVCWTDFGSSIGDVRYKVFTAEGVALNLADRTANTISASTQSGPDVTALAGGGFVISWQDSSSGNLDVRYRVFDAVGNPTMASDAVVGGNTSLNQSQPTVVGLPDGGFAIAWTDTNVANSGLPNGGSSAIVAQSFTAEGSPASGLVRLSGGLGGDANASMVAYADRISLIWEDSLGPTPAQNGEDGIYTRTIAGAWPVVGFTDGGTRLDTNGPFREATDAPDLAWGSLGILSVWDDVLNATGPLGRDIYASLISPAGVPQPAFKVNVADVDAQTLPVVAGLPFMAATYWLGRPSLPKRRRISEAG